MTRRVESVAFRIGLIVGVAVSIFINSKPSDRRELASILSVVSHPKDGSKNVVLK